MSVAFDPSKITDGETWIFANTKGAEALLSTLKASSDRKVTPGSFEYMIQGEESQFIARKPVK
jgi:hypothetical protein